MKPKPRKAAAASAEPAAVPVVLFGVDPSGKPKAARFSDKHASLATKAAGQLQLQVLPLTNHALVDLAARLPIGRIHANGRGFVPFVKRDVYIKLVEAAGKPAGANGSHHSPPTTSAAASVHPGTAAERPRHGDGRLPPNWDGIATGDVVVAQETLEDGWYEAIVVEVRGEMLTLRWHDWPKDRSFSRHRLSIALLYPGESTSQSAAHSKQRGSKQPAPEAGANQTFPRNWQEISAGKLVLAPEDGPMRGFWEAIAAEQADDQFTLRWRDYPRVARVVRQRFAVALLHPNGNGH
jgi:hypothetical protein